MGRRASAPATGRRQIQSDRLGKRFGPEAPALVEPAIDFDLCLRDGLPPEMFPPLARRRAAAPMPRSGPSSSMAVMVGPTS